MLSVSPSTVYTWLKARRLRGHQLGTSWFIMREDLREALHAGDNFRDTSSEPEDLPETD